MFFNCLLDGFPEECLGYRLNTDYRVGILITLLFEDESIDFEVKLIQACNLLFADRVPDNVEEALRIIQWFLSCGRSEEFFEDGYTAEKAEEKCLDFNQDHLDIWGAFWSKGIDLNEVDMHWFKFMSAISSVGDCPLSQKMGYRAMSLKKMKGETRAHYKEIKDKVKVRKLVSKEEFEAKVKAAEEKHGSYYAKLLKAQQL